MPAELWHPGQSVHKALASVPLNVGILVGGHVDIIFRGVAKCCQALEQNRCTIVSLFSPCHCHNI